MVDEDKVLKLKTLLKKIFQFENNDLDFGIYRILNIKKRKFLSLLILNYLISSKKI
ncbi:hypothetical protein [Methanosalsum zhilinae]|uniref:hypothetical protein n=1 Tax=Methanosalsum zhilinae TaxID=39669 RepID=UPI0012F6B88C|nr:hypothetical protein [Methanosalsum zhilinae]